MKNNIRIQEAPIEGKQLITIDVLTVSSQWFEVAIIDTDPQYGMFHKLCQMANGGEYEANKVEGGVIKSSVHINEHLRHDTR